MKVSVIIPIFNGIKFIGEALESVYNQSKPVEEVICIDDASDDHVDEYIRDNYPKVRLFKNTENRGPSFCRNLGLEKSTCSMIAFLDADDFWTPGKTKCQMDQFNYDNSLEIVGGLSEYFQSSEDGKSNQSVKREHFNAYLGSLLIKKSVFEKVGNFNVDMRLSEDQDWFLRVRESRISMQITGDIVLKIRIHDQNTTKDLNFKQTELVKVIKMSLDRRRETENFSDLDKIKI